MSVWTHTTLVCQHKWLEKSVWNTAKTKCCLTIKWSFPNWLCQLPRCFISIFNLISKQNITLNSFEALVLKPSPSAVNWNRFHLYELYRHPGPCSQFLEEFGDFISDLITHCDKVLVIGDFSIQIDFGFDSMCICTMFSLSQTMSHNCGEIGLKLY